MSDYLNDEYSFDDSFDESLGKYNSSMYHQLEDNVSLHVDTDEVLYGVKRIREDKMNVEQPVKKFKIDNANFMAFYAKAYEKEGK